MDTNVSVSERLIVIRGQRSLANAASHRMVTINYMQYGESSESQSRTYMKTTAKGNIFQNMEAGTSWCNESAGGSITITDAS